MAVGPLMANLGNALTGWLGEQALDRALLIPSGGRLIPWVPLIDAHGIDRAYSWDGVGAPLFVQVKTSGAPDAAGRHHWKLRVGSFPTHERFVVVLTLFSSATNKIDDELFWSLDAAAVRRLGQREYDSSLRTEVYRLDASPVHADRLAPYRHAGDSLWRMFAHTNVLKTPKQLRLPTLNIDQGGLYEFATITELFKANRKDLLVFRPVVDIHGRDLLVQLVGSSRARYLQVKGTAVTNHGGQLLFHVQRSTFVPADDFSIVLYFWERRSNRFFKECWLVESRELKRRTAYQSDSRRLFVDAHLDPSVDTWADCRVAVQDLAGVLRTGLANERLAA